MKDQEKAPSEGCQSDFDTNAKEPLDTTAIQGAGSLANPADLEFPRKFRIIEEFPPSKVRQKRDTEVAHANEKSVVARVEIEDVIGSETLGMKADLMDQARCETLEKRRKTGFKMKNPRRAERPKSEGFLKWNFHRKRGLDAEEFNAAAVKGGSVAQDKLSVIIFSMKTEDQHFSKQGPGYCAPSGSGATFSIVHFSPYIQRSDQGDQPAQISATNGH